MGIKLGDSWNGWAPALLIFLFGGAIGTVVFAYSTFELKTDAEKHETADRAIQAAQIAALTEVVNRMIRVEDKIDYIGDLPPGWKKKGN